MPDKHLQFHSSNGKRQIILVEDEAVNREILSAILNERYDVVTAETGREALSRIYANRDTASLVLLDLNLPDMHGMDILTRVKADPQLSRLPVIVMTADKDAEVESLTIGAIDFIPKPYPLPKVILARVQRTIELSEDRDILRSTERDQVTGLYNREFFFSYAEQYDTFHKDKPMDAIVVDINHFHMVNERYGRAYGDEVLRRIGESIRERVMGEGGIVTRRENDTFLVYCPHRSDYVDILENASASLDSRVRLRMGVYPEVDKTLDIERRFDRAKMASDTVRNSFTKVIAIYDSALHESEIFAEQLLEDFPKAIEEKQFVVYYQPKFDIRPAVPLLGSAEALVRWKHPQLGMISPGVFIPLFESNGLVQQLDSYVWRETARQLHDWKTRLGVSVPVSVNVSRVDLFEPRLVENLQSLIREFGLAPEELLLEITESAYTQDSEQIIEMVHKLREAGFRIEMDDFGSGYSSLNMISSLPVDALKLDMQFVRNAFKERKNTRMLDVVIDIAASLEVPTIAEGVETAEQMFTLRAMGCDIVQGYYFSRPLPAEEFEPFLLARWEAVAEQAEGRTARGARGTEKYTYDALHDPKTGLYNHSAYEMLLRDADQGHIALLVASVDDYERLCAQLGPKGADPIAVRVAEVLRANFRSVDYVCRISPDEFVVIMTRVNSSMRKLVFDKVEQVNAALQKAADGVPALGLSVGVAFGDRENPQGDIFQDADTALYRMKEMKHCGCAIY